MTSELIDQNDASVMDAFSRAAAPVAPELELDIAKYLPEVEEFDLSEAQKIELLQTVWDIMRRFVELGFKPETCGQLLGIFNEAAGASAPALDSEIEVRERGKGAKKKEEPTYG